MTDLLLPWYLAKPGTGMQRKGCQVAFDLAAMSSDRWRLSFGELLTEEDLRSLSADPHTDRPARALHSVSLVHSVGNMLTRAYGANVPPAPGRLPMLQPHDQAVSALTLDDSPASFTGNALVCQYVPDGPWACLSHDIMAHEAGHAWLHDWRGWIGRNGPEHVEANAALEALSDVFAVASACRYSEVRRSVTDEVSTGLLDHGNDLSRLFIDPSAGLVVRDLTRMPDDATSVHGRGHVLGRALYRSLCRRALALSAEQPLDAALGLAAAEWLRIVMDAVHDLPGAAPDRIALARQIVEEAPAPWAAILEEELTDVELLPAARPADFAPDAPWSEDLLELRDRLLSEEPHTGDELVLVKRSRREARSRRVHAVGERRITQWRLEGASESETWYVAHDGRGRLRSFRRMPESLA